MKRTTINRFLAGTRLVGSLISAGILGGCLSAQNSGRKPAEGNAVSTQNVVQYSTVNIHNTMQMDNFSNPWQAERPMQGSGTGFVIQGKRILTNAHVVSNSRFLEVQKNGDPKRYIARVRFAGHDCDLALLDVDDPDFFNGTQPVTFAEALPKLGDTVTAIGFPLGGSRVSITRGVVSRIDHGSYAHSAVDQHLVLQVDAAINPGNSGGPVVFNGNVVGVAFQGLSQGQNIGYAIPVPVIHHFLADIEDGTYDGYPELGVQYLELRNPAMRASLGVPSEESGVVVTWLDPFGSAVRDLIPGDVLLRLDDHNIAEDGTIELDGNPVAFTELLERRQSGDTVSFKIFRKGAILDLFIPLKNRPDPFVFRNLYDIQPEYAILGGLVFAPLSREILKTITSGFDGPNDQNLLYLSQYAKQDGYGLNHDECVIFIRRLPHPVNTYTDAFINGLVVSVNGAEIRNMKNLIDAFAKPEGGFHVIRFAGTDDPLILNADAVTDAQMTILKQYGVPAPFNINALSGVQK